jgi:iron complex transport system permease protein
LDKDCKEVIYKKTFITTAIVLFFVIIFALSTGRYTISFLDTIKILLSRIAPIDNTWGPTAEGVIFNLRLPRLFGAILIGSAFAISGASYQAVFKNPLVSPDLLGVSSGATVGAALAIIFGGDKLIIQIGAFLGGIIAVVLATTIPKLLKNNSIMLLVLSGIIVSGLMSSIIGIIKFLADPEDQLAAIVYWQMGSLAKIHMPDIYAISPVIAITSIILIAVRWRINILTLGDREAQLLGVNVTLLRAIVIICATMLTASAVSISGTIGWLGLVIPHLARLLVGPDNTKVFPISIILGAIFLIIVDTLARVLTPAELPLTILTGLIGAPFYFWLLARQRVRL